jgi:hypothetical protein
MEVAPGLNSPVHIPGHCVNGTWSDCHDTHGTNPALALLGTRTVGLLHLKLSPALLFDVRN